MKPDDQVRGQLIDMTTGLPTLVRSGPVTAWDSERGWTELPEPPERSSVERESEDD